MQAANTQADFADLGSFYSQIIALFFSVYGVFGEHEGVAPCGYPWGLSVLGISLVYFMLLDVVKVQIFRYWSFEMTAKMVPTKARRAKLANRKELSERGEALETSWKKITATPYKGKPVQTIPCKNEPVRTTPCRVSVV